MADTLKISKYSTLCVLGEWARGGTSWISRLPQLTFAIEA
jgi:hypothetical protein